MKYFSDGTAYEVDLTPATQIVDTLGAARRTRGAAAGHPLAVSALSSVLGKVQRSLDAMPIVASRLSGPPEMLRVVSVATRGRAAPAAPSGTMTTATDCVAVEGAKTDDIRWARDQYGAEIDGAAPA